MQEQDLAVVILAAGKGTRMQNPLPKVLIPIFGKPALEYVLDEAEKLFKSYFNETKNYIKQIK